VVRRALVLTVLCLGAPALARSQISPGALARPHERLEGALQCVKCHAGGGGRGIGKEQMTGQCLNCHKEIAWLVERERGVHGRVREQRCSSCHPEHAGRDFALISWPDGGDTPDRFDHARAGWALEGSHARRKCVDCHKTAFRVSPAARLSQRPAPAVGWVGLETRCTSCHEDAHRGALDRNCLKCHDAEHWKPAPRFDHGKTDYRLTGAHAVVPCADCHANPRLQLTSDARGVPIPRYRPLAHQECSACHADPHKGQLGTTCARCHVTTAFKTINRASFDHDRTRYPLRGRHAEVSCEKCHDFAAGRVARNPAFGTCTACHTPDPHAGTATLAGRVVDCASCHTVDGFRPSSYTVAQHRLTKYPLEGRHQQARCAACHVKTVTAGVTMRPVTATCVSCHLDPHGKRYAQCSDCHNLQGFRPATTDLAAHQRFRFPLEGAHRAVPCLDCHADMRRASAPSTLALARWSGPPLLFAAPKGGCAGCHENLHGGQFATRPDGAACETCHDTDAFRPARRFDHNRDAAFSLKGAHTGVPCERCHRTTRGAGGKPVVIYRPVPNACEACHR
jgi:hypothetical protein